MGEFLASEKIRLLEFKSKSAYFTDEARSNGVYKDHSYSHCLPLNYAEQNLFPGIREKALNHFQKNEIKWHDGLNGRPS